MYSIPTVTIQNGKGETVVVDAYQYHRGLCSFKPPLLGGDWVIVSENNASSKEGIEKVGQFNELVQGLKKKREEQPLKKRIKLQCQ